MATRIDVNAELIQSLILVKTNIGGWFFDAFLKLDHKSSLAITDHPVQSGVSVSDHAYLKPRILTIDVGMSECGRQLIPTQFSGSWSRSVRAYQVLTDMQKSRIPVTVLTRLGQYKNMLVEDIDVSDDYKTLFGLKATVMMKELIVAEVTTVKISASSQLTGATKRGIAEPIKVNESVAYSLGLGAGATEHQSIFGGG